MHALGTSIYTVSLNACSVFLVRQPFHHLRHHFLWVCGRRQSSWSSCFRSQPHSRRHRRCQMCHPCSSTRVSCNAHTRTVGGADPPSPGPAFLPEVAVRLARRSAGKFCTPGRTRSMSFRCTTSGCSHRSGTSQTYDESPAPIHMHINSDVSAWSLHVLTQ